VAQNAHDQQLNNQKNKQLENGASPRLKIGEK
jgi:hypothetical protein